MLIFDLRKSKFKSKDLCINYILSSCEIFVEYMVFKIILLV